MPTTDISNCQTGTTEGLMAALARNTYDAQRDVFSYQLPTGAQNAFMIFPDGVALRSPVPTKVSTNTTLSSFTVVDESGTTYQFTNGELVQGNYQSVWYLNQITGPNPVDGAFYSYTSIGTSTPLDLTDQVSVIDRVFNRDPPGAVTPSPGQVQASSNPISVDQTVPSRIHFPGGKVEFVLENRPSTDESTGSRLKAIEVYGTSTGGTYTLIKKFALMYTYTPRTNGSNTLFLTQVVLTGTDNAGIGSYSMTYNSTPLPPSSSRDKDYWGYYNGNNGNTALTTLLPPIPIPYQPDEASPSTTTITIGAANREPNAAFMQAGIIEQITYPTGGYSVFAFEPNQYLDQSLQTAGGLRIRQIRHFTVANALASQKTYRYGSAENGAGTIRFGKPFAASTKPSFYPVERIIEQLDAGSQPVVYRYRLRVYTSSPSYPLTPEEGSPVTYSVVTEYEDNGVGALGKTIHQFRDDALDESVVFNGKGYDKSRSWNRGQLLSKTVYDAQNHLKMTEVHSYSSLVPTNAQTSQLAGVLVSFARESATQGGNQFPGSNYCNRYNYPLSYQWEYGLVKPSSTTVYLHDDIDPTRFTLKTTQTDYSTRHYQPTETRTYVEGGSIVGTRYSYPQDFTYTIPSSAEFQLIGIKTLQDQNVYQSIETISFKQEPMKQREYKTGQLTTFTAVTVSGKPIALPYHIYITETDFNNKTTQTGSSTGPYAPSAESYNANSNPAVTPQPDTFPIDYVWQNPRLTMTGYDAQGKLTSYSLTAGSTTSYTNATVTPTGGVLLSFPTTETKNKGQPSAQVTTFGYDVPLLGVSRITQPNGVYVQYEYDTFGRLVRIRDQQGNLLKQFTYRYATSTESVP